MYFYLGYAKQLTYTTTSFNFVSDVGFKLKIVKTHKQDDSRSITVIGKKISV